LFWAASSLLFLRRAGAHVATAHRYTREEQFLFEDIMRIYQSNNFLMDLTRQVRKGALLPAAFQRPYVWAKSDVMALIESILLGYPIGGFLIWSPWGKADLAQVSRYRLGPIEGMDETARVSLLLDGQNRLATLAWMGHDYALPVPDDMTEQELATWPVDERLVADLATQTIKYVPVGQEHDGFRMPAAALLHSAVSNVVFRKRWPEWSEMDEEKLDAGMKWFDKVSAAFQEARVVVTEISEATAEEAQHAFMHICKVGVPLSEKDFAAAMAWATAAPAPADPVIADGNQELNNSNTKEAS
jgi:hypothetical protein